MPAQERSLDKFHGSTFRWLYGSAAGLGTLLLLLGGVALALLLEQPLLLLATGAGLVILFWKWLSNLASRYEITNQRLILRRGLIMKSVDEVELYRVKDVKLDFSLLGQVAGIGDITLVTSDHSARDGGFVMHEIPRAAERRERLRGLVEEIRQHRRVREFDVGGDWV